MLKTFHQHRSELERLVEMFRHDKGLGRVGRNFTRPADPGRVGVSAARIAEYRRLCDAIGAPNCIEGYDSAFDSTFPEEKNPILIHVSAKGFALPGSGSGKGFVYSMNPDAGFIVVGDLDAVVPNGEGDWLRRIEGPWYLHFDTN